MKFKFDAKIPHQMAAMDAVLNVFEGSQSVDGMAAATAMQTFDLELFQGMTQTDHGLGNTCLDRDNLLKRIQQVQQKNDIQPSTSLDVE